MANHPPVITLSGFKGINNVDAPERTGNEYLKTISNIDIDRAGKLYKRKGYSKVLSGSGIHSLWSNGKHCYFVEDGDLKYLYSDYTTLTIVSGFSTGHTEYLEIGEEVYVLNSGKNVILQGDTYRSFGIDVPNVQPTLTEGSGRLTAGRYQVAISYVDTSGRESGRVLSSVIEVSDKSSIILTGLVSSNDVLVDRTRIYVTTPNGEVLYYLIDVVDTTNTYTISDVYGAISSATEIGITSPSSGDIMAYFNSRLYIGDGRTLWFSQPFSYEWFDISKDFLQFPDEITMVMPVELGIYVGTTKRLYWLSGSDAAEFRIAEKEYCHPVKYSNVQIPSNYISIDNTPFGPKWLFTSDEGIYICMNQGMTFNVTSSNVSFPKAIESVSTFLQHDGIDAYVSLLKDEEDDSQNASFGDLITSTVIRNGITI